MGWDRARAGSRLLLWLALAVLPVSHAAAHGVSLKLHHPYSADSAFHRNFLLPWTAKVEQQSGGRIRFHLYPDSPSGESGLGLYDSVREGDAVHVAWTPVPVSPQHFPRLTAMQQPFTVRGAEGGSRAMWEYTVANDVLDRDFDEVRVLAMHFGDAARLHFGKAFPTAPTDMGGRRIAAVAPADAELLKAAGAEPVLLSADRVVAAVEEGAVDGALLSWERTTAVGLDRIVRSHVDLRAGTPGMTSAAFVLVMGVRTFRSLPDDLKTVVEANSGRETSAWLGRVLDEAGVQARAAAVARGDSVRTMTQQEEDRWLAAARSVSNAQAAALERTNVRASPLFESAREQLQEFDAVR